MKDALHTLRLIGIAMFICRRWLDVLYGPALVLIGLTSLALLYYWRANAKEDNFLSVLLVIICVIELLDT